MTEASEMDATRAPLLEHLRELRRRVAWAVAGYLAAVVVAWIYRVECFDFLMAPYEAAMRSAFPELSDYLNFRSLMEPLIVYVKVALIVGLVVAAPFILLQVWLFVAPGLYRRERAYAAPFLISSLVLFYGGVVLCHTLVLEETMRVLIGFGGVGLTPTIMMSDYFGFTTQMLLVFGALFELPVIVSFLSLLGVVRVASLMGAWRYVTVGVFVVAGVLTPSPEPVSQVILAGALLVLYILSIGVAALIERARGGRREAGNA